ncbi:MAG: hypothetical protein MUC48_07835 [Leptolyngbya sp. Prado105]|jgi:hypothetical protein|nr:hypothetical protein [Leptolyngbya sp. Prado105]
MKATNLVSASLTADDQKEVMNAIALIKSKLPFLLSTTAEERKALTKMGDKSQAFVSLALDLANQSQDYLPRSFEVEEMRKDVELYQQLRPILLALTQLQELVDNTSMVAGSEAMVAALTVYNAAKEHGQDAGLEAILAEMSQRFARMRKTKADEVAVSN